MISFGPQLLCHLFGDYIFQSDWMALNKSKKSIPCLVHVLLYTACFLLLTTSWKALLVIGATHYVLDRYPIILRRLIWYKNHLNPGLFYAPFEKCSVTGYYDNIMEEVQGVHREMWSTVQCDETKRKSKYFNSLYVCNPRINYISIWLYIITDNLFHVAINYFALTYL